MILFKIMGVLSTIGFSLPLIAILKNRLTMSRSFQALALYLVLVSLTNLLVIIAVDPKVLVAQGFINNFLDAPLSLIFLMYFVSANWQKKWMIYLIIGLVTFQSAILITYGFTKTSLTYFLAPGLLLTLGISIYLFVQEVKHKDVFQKSFGRVLITASFVLAYCGYVFLYAGYYLFETPYIVDAKLIYFLFTFICYTAMGIGIFMERKHIAHDIEEKRSHAELRELYGEEHTKTAGTNAPAEINLGKIPWN